VAAVFKMVEIDVDHGTQKHTPKTQMIDNHVTIDQ
jgi:hypothetical protein